MIAVASSLLYKPPSSRKLLFAGFDRHGQTIFRRRQRARREWRIRARRVAGHVEVNHCPLATVDDRRIEHAKAVRGGGIRGVLEQHEEVLALWKIKGRELLFLIADPERQTADRR